MVYSTEKQSNDLKENGDLKAAGSHKNEENGQIWDHSWSTNEIRKSSNHWTLAGDVGLLNHLQDFSHKLISRTHEMEKVVDSLVHMSKVAGAKVNNVINDFQMLSNLQFVENRVYDEEVQEVQKTPAQEPQPKSKEQREADMLPRVIQALELGVSVLDKAFERIEVDETSESEEDDDDDIVSQGRTILEPKDMYEHRPLPFIIGSEEFQKDDFAGLHSIIEDESSSEMTQDDNISPSVSSESEEEEEIDELPIQQQPFVPDRKNTVISVDALSVKSSGSESSDLFNMGDEENGYISDSPTEKKTNERNAQNSLMEELMHKTKAVPSDKSKPESIQSPLSNEVPEEKENDDLFAAGDNFLPDDETSPFRKKSGLFSGDGVFSSEKEDSYEGSLFDGQESLPPVEKKAAPVNKVQVLPTTIKPLNKRNETSGNKSSKSSDLFGDEDNEDLFSSLSPPNFTSVQKSSKVGSKVSSTADIKKAEEKAPASPLPATTKKSAVSFDKDPVRSGSLFDDDSDGDDLFTESKKSQKNVALKFGGDYDDDDLFSSEPSKPVQEAKDLKGKKVTAESQKAIKKHEASLFEESDNFDLFKPMSSSNLKAEVSNISTKAENKGVQPSNVNKAPNILFEESGSFDLFAPPKEVKDLKPFSPIEETQKLDDKVIPPSQKLDEKVIPPPKKLDEKVIPPPKKLDEKVIPPPKKLDEKVIPPSKKLDEKVPHRKVHEVENTTVIEKAPLLTSNDIQNDTVSNDFDKPSVTGNTLHAINKNRAKIQVKRKRPTRKGRQARLSTDSDFEKEGDGVTNVMSKPVQPRVNTAEIVGTKETSTGSQRDLETSPPNKPLKFHKQQEQDKRNLMSQLIFEASASKILKQSTVADIEEDSDDLFSSKGKENKKPLGSDFSFLSQTPLDTEILVKANSDNEGPKPESSSVLLSDSTSDEDLFSAPSFREFRNSISDKNSIFADDDDDDIFKASVSKDNVSQHSSDVLGDDDDIFAGVEKEKYEMFPTQVFSDDDDEDDIFSNLEKPKKDSTPKPKVTEQTNKVEKKKEAVFDDPLGGLSMNS